jgi:hypothetical protein
MFREETMSCSGSVLGRPKNARQVKKRTQEHTHHFFFYIKGTVHKEFVPAGQAVNSAYYRDVSRQLRKNV